MRPILITTRITTRETDSFKKYLSEISDIEPFETARAENKCAMRAWKGDEKAREELIKRNLRFVVSCAKQYIIKGVSLEDLVNEGNIGISTAATRFDPTKGFKFISYAVWYIRKDIVSFLTNNSRAIRLPNNKVDAVSKYKKDLDMMEQELQRSVEPNDMLLVKDKNGSFKYTKDDITLLEELTKTDIASLDMEVGEDGSACLSDLLTDSSMGRADDLVMRSDMVVSIDTMFASIDPEDRELINMLYGLDGHAPSTLADVGEKFHLSRETVRQRKERILRTIKKKFNKSGKALLED